MKSTLIVFVVTGAWCLLVLCPSFFGDKEMVRRIWEMTDSLGSTFIWQCPLSF